MTTNTTENKLDFNRNERQFRFNEIKGSVTELNDGLEWCSITLNVGHESPRLVNIAVKKVEFDKIAKRFLLGDKVTIRFYITSRLKNERWYTTANLLQIDAVV